MTTLSIRQDLALRQSEAMESLREEIFEAAEENAWDKKSFVPKTKLKNLITKEKIDQICTINPGTAFDNSIKVIATLGYNLKLDAKAFTTLDKAGLTDKRLPVTFDTATKTFVSTSKESDIGNESGGAKREVMIFKPFSSSGADCAAFARDQWLFLSPTFGDAEHSELDIHCPLPITYLSDESWGGSFGEVRKIKMHHAHLKLDPEPVSLIWSLSDPPCVNTLKDRRK
jgi:hypothetical protein